MTRLLLAVVCTLLVAGCTDSSTTQPPPPSPPPSQPPSTSSGSTASPTEVRETPEEFVRRWLGLVEDLNASGQSGALLEASHDCSDCEAMAKTVTDMYAAGGWIHSDGYQARRLKVVREVGSKVVIRFELTAGASTYQRSESSPVQRTEPSTGMVQATIGRVNGDLKMLAFVRVAA